MRVLPLSEKYKRLFLSPQADDTASSNLVLVEKHKRSKGGIGFERPAVPTHYVSVHTQGSTHSNVSINGGKYESFIFGGSSMIIAEANANDAFVHVRGTRFTTETASWSSVHFLPSLIGDACSEFADKDPANVSLLSHNDYRDPMLQQLALALSVNTDRYGPDAQVYNETIAQLLSVHLLLNCCTRKYKVPKYTDTIKNRHWARVVDYIQFNLREDLSLEVMAKLTCMSRFHFSHAFKKQFGVAPHQFIISCRMEKARELLKTTSSSVSTIARSVGYANPASFTRNFTRMIGISPTDFRLSFI